MPIILRADVHMCIARVPVNQLSGTYIFSYFSVANNLQELGLLTMRITFNCSNFEIKFRAQWLKNKI